MQRCFFVRVLTRTPLNGLTTKTNIGNNANVGKKRVFRNITGLKEQSSQTPRTFKLAKNIFHVQIVVQPNMK